MTRDQIIALAREAFVKRGFWPNEVMWECWKDAWLAGVAAERERCAKIVEQYTGAWDDEGFALAAKIRKGE